ncbi:MAG: SPOR domain-containing protein [Bacteroidales bacterium]|nr:SPOR domain-containing protein [Bacteroidales bacterium]
MRKDSDANENLNDDLDFSPNESEKTFNNNGNSSIDNEEPLFQLIGEPSNIASTDKEEVKNEVSQKSVVEEPKSAPVQASEPEQDEIDEISDDEEEEEPKKRRGLWIILLLLLLLLLLGGGIWYYFAKVKQAPVEPPVVVVQDTVKEEPKPEPEPEPEPEPVIDTIPEIVEDTVVEAPKKVYTPARIATKNKVPTSGWLIGYRATADEVEAIKIVAEMSYVDGLPCGYYWINDARKGKPLFKVYVGPYKTREEVEAVFPTIKAKVPDAHIFSENATMQQEYNQQKKVYTAEVEEK